MKAMAFAIALAGMTLAAPAHAEVVASGPNGFVIRHVVAAPVTADVAWRRFSDLASWWTPEHTYTGSAKNLSLRLRQGGCWCEKLPDNGFVEHMRVVYVAPNRTLRLSGGLGPLQELGVSGAMTVSFEADGPSSKITMTYAVGGYTPNGLGPLAPIVDGVLGAQMLRFRQVLGERR
jgi:uncharacterized protein YndB with AHSA1/START domain